MQPGLFNEEVTFSRFLVSETNSSPSVHIILILTPLTTFIVLLSQRGHCKSSSGSFDECRPSARWPPTLKPSKPTWPVSPLVGCYHPQPPLPFIIITWPESKLVLHIHTYTQCTTSIIQSGTIILGDAIKTRLLATVSQRGPKHVTGQYSNMFQLW